MYLKDILRLQLNIFHNSKELASYLLKFKEFSYFKEGGFGPLKVYSK